MDVMVATPVAARPYAAARDEANGSGISWAAVSAGAFAAAALWLILLLLGVGLGLSSISPWSPAGIGSTAIGAATVVWLILTQAIAAAIGGYLAGRLRTKWASIHTDEVYFRDTAHGFLAWAVGVVITAAFLTSAATSIVGGGVLLGSSAAAGAATLHAPLLPGSRSPADATALPQETPLHQSDAVAARDAADTARRAVAKASLWLFVALLTGAFCASLAATAGGRQRDRAVLAIGPELEA